MLGKTKNFLFNLCKKKTILFVFFFSFFGLTFARSASAGWVWDMILGIPSRTVLLIFWVFARLAILTVKLAGIFLNWVLSPNFISLSYTNPANNEIIKTGLGVTQGFVNMLLVLILVYIAIATILRLAGYETKKLLITFIIVALLVNFAPVICGLVVDASNIVMNFFIQDIKADAFGENMAGQVNNLLSGFEWASLEIDTALPRAFQMMIMTGFLFVLSFILFLFAVLFILRHLVIWLLVILSPLAFACYILPITKKYFDKWWEQFISWSFIGVSCGFFLYLGLLFVTKVPNVITPPQTGETPLFNNILPYFVSAIFLGIGLVFGLKTSAIGASTAINLTKRSQGWARRRGKWAAKEGAKKIGRGIRPIVEGRARKLAAGAYSTMVKIGNWSPTGGEFKPGVIFKWAVPKRLKDFGNLRPVIDEGMKEADGKSGRVIGDEIANQKVQGAKATGWYSQLLKQNDSQDLFDAFRRKVGKGAGGKKWKKMSDEEITNDVNFHRIMAPILVHASNSGKLGSTLRRDPRVAEVAYEKDIGSYGKSRPDMNSPQDAVNKAVTEARDHLKDWEPESLKSQKVTGGVMAHLERDRQLQVNRQIKKGRETQLETMDEMFSDFARENKSSLFGDSNISEEKIAKLLSPKGTDPETGKSIESEAHKKVWREFDKHIKKTFGGRQYFVSVEEQRMQTSGWRRMEFVPKKPSGPSSPPTPGSTTMGSSPPEEKTKPLKTGEKTSNIPTTGRQGKKASDIPTTGKKGKKRN